LIGHERDAAVEAVVEDLRRGRPVLVVDDAERENEADLIVPAELATAETVGFFVRHTSGIICVGMDPLRLAELSLPQMVVANEDARGTAFTVSVDAAAGTTTGISAVERANTVRLLASPTLRAADLTRPGHVFPLAAKRGGVLQRRGHTEAAVDLARMAGCTPAGMLAEVVGDDGIPLRGTGLVSFGAEHGLRTISIEEIVRYRERHERLVEHVASARLPTKEAVFTVHAFRSLLDNQEHLALTLGDVAGGPAPLVRIHSECLTGDVASSMRCDCGDQWQAAMSLIAAERTGVLIYLRGHEGRGIGLAAKIAAYALQDEEALDTIDANKRLGLPVDARSYVPATQILASLGIERVRLLSNNHAKAQAIMEAGIGLEARVPLIATPAPSNLAYLRAKQDRLGHSLDLPPAIRGASRWD
jgi:3,4-dihydroxy 2-butanone 4-phosphate synthase / GTP cyclohydrolase II